jgi:hypothetical protein
MVGIHTNWMSARAREPDYQFTTHILHTYISMIHYKSFSIILLTYKLFTSFTNCRLTHYPPITISQLHYIT